MHLPNIVHDMYKDFRGCSMLQLLLYVGHRVRCTTVALEWMSEWVLCFNYMF